MKLSFLRILIFIILSSCGNSEYDWIDRTKHEGLINLNASDKFETYSTQSNPKNINFTLQNLELSKVYFDNLFNEDLNFAVLFIDTKNWDKYAFSPPPGMPQAYHEGNMVLGLGKSAMAVRSEKRITNMPENAIKKLQKHFGGNIDLDKFFRDGLALHELGHLYHFYRTGKNPQRQWLNELFANLCQVGASKNLKDQSIFNQMDTYQSMLFENNHWGKLEYKSLEQFEKDYFHILKTPQNYGWYQIRFFMIAKELHHKFGDDIIKKFREFLIECDANRFGKVGDEQLNIMLQNKFGKEVMEILTWSASN